MKNSIKTLVGLVILAIAVNASAQISATATATANGTIVCPMTLNHSGTDLNFGSVIAGGSAGSMTVNPDGTFSYTGGASEYHGSATHVAPSAAQFTVGGQAGYHFHIDVPVAASVALGGGTVNFVSNLDPPVDPAFPVDNGGCVTMPLNVGGTWTIPAGMAPGTYSSTFSVTVHYN